MAGSTIGEVEVKLILDDKPYSQGLSSIAKTTDKAGKDFSAKWSVATGIVISATQKAFDAVNNLITTSISSAIKRVDTLNAFPRVMKNLGIESEAATEVISDLGDRLKGLPTTLDSAASAVQRFTTVNGDIKKSEEIFLAVNNAIIAGGASMDIQSSALEQLSQAYAKGKPDMMEWRTLQTAMPAQLKQIATAMLGNEKSLNSYMKLAQAYAKANPMSSIGKELVEQLDAISKGSGDMSTALGTALRAGVIPMDEFTAAIVELNKNGLNGFASLETQARDASGGIETSLANMRSAVVRGVQSVIQSIGQEKIQAILSAIGEIVEDKIKKVASLISWLGDHVDILKVFSAAISGLGVAMAAVKVAKFYNGIVKGVTTVTKFAGVMKSGLLPVLLTVGKTLITTVIPAVLSFGAALLANPITWIVLGITALAAGLILLWNKCEGFRNFVIGAVNAIAALIGNVASFIVNVFQTIWNFAKPIIDGVISAFQVFWGIVSSIFSALWNTVQTVFQAIWNFIQPIVNLLVQAFQNWWNTVSAIFSWLWSNAQIVFSNIKQIVTVVIGVIVGLFQGLWSILSTIFGWIWNIVQTVFNNIKQIVSAVIGAIVALFQNLWNFIWPILQNIGNFFGTIFGAVWNVVSGVFNNIRNAVQGAWNFIVGIFSGIGNFFKNVFTQAFNAVKNVFSGIGNFFKGIWDTITGIFTKIGTTIGNAVSGAFKSVVNTVIGFLENVVNAPVRAINALINVINAIPGINLGHLNELHLPRMAHGGIVPGTSYSGDHNLIMANSGEMVITRSQQAMLWDAIESGTFGGMDEETTNNYGGNNDTFNFYNTINNEFDMDEFNSKVEQTIRRAVA